MQKYKVGIMMAIVLLVLPGHVYAKDKTKNFEGNGTKESPYLIQNETDLLNLRDGVNEQGKTYKGRYFLQTEDIDLGEDAWVAIGNMEEEAYFCGLYDGGGHVIKNLNMEEENDAAMFNVLGGSVYNLGLDDGKIKGNCVASFANHSVDDTSYIVNCYSRLDLDGNRVGGIVDDFSGNVIGCWTEGNYSGGDISGIVGYCAKDVSYCFSDQEKLIGEQGVADETGNQSIEAARIDTEDFEQAFNKQLYKVSLLLEENEVRDLKLWEMKAGKCGFSQSGLMEQEIPLEGAGSKEKPYLVQSYDDLCVFAAEVNMGMDFAEQYVEQTVNIDIPENAEWIPIGRFGTENYFYGEYNGAGHYINNLVIDSEDNVGLFGVLGGTVKNLGIESGSISGNCVGSIACMSEGHNGNIINCYNKAALHGTTRASGIVDSFAGNVANCWNVGEVDAPVAGGICAYTALNIEKCYAIKDGVSEEFWGNIVDIEVVSPDDINSQKFVDTLNRNVYDLGKMAKYRKMDGVYWKTEDGRLTFRDASEVPEIVNKWDMVRRIPFFIVGGIFLYILVAMVIHAGKMLKKESSC